jgi:hypothetical protein
VNESPYEPCEKAARFEMTGLEDGEILAHDRHVALVSVPKQSPWFAPTDLIGDQAPHMAALLDGGLRNAGYGSPILLDGRRVSDHEYVWFARQIEERLDQRSARPVRFDAKQLDDR